MAPLEPLLAAYKLRSGGDGIVFPAGWRGLRGGTAQRAPTFIRPHTLHRHLETLRKQDAQAKRGSTLPPPTWYQCTRHTFASQWVMNGGSIEKLSVMMGHSSTVVTQRYAHLRPELFREADYQVFDVDMTPPAGKLHALGVADDCSVTARSAGAAPEDEAIY